MPHSCVNEMVAMRFGARRLLAGEDSREGGLVEEEVAHGGECVEVEGVVAACERRQWAVMNRMIIYTKLREDGE